MQEGVRSLGDGDVETVQVTVLWISLAWNHAIGEACQEYNREGDSN